MKKIVGIIAALALVSAVFADEPSVTPVVAEFKGDASLEWIANLDNETTGMKNDASASFKIKFVTEGTKATEGDGLWGELEIKAGNWEVAYGEGAAVFTGVKLKDKDGNVATTDDKGKTTFADKDGKEITADKFDMDSAYYVYDTKNVLTVPGKPSVEKAIIHFVEGDFYAKMDIKAPSLEVGGGDILTATSSAKAFPKKSVTLTDKAGFTLSFGLPIVDFNVQFADNGEKKSDAKEFAFVFDATAKLLDEGALTAYAGVGYSTEGKQDAAIAAKIAYKLALDIGDGMYVKPGVGFAMQGDAKDLGAGVLFGWGGDGIEAKFESFSNKVTNVPDKCADGVSVYVNSTLADKAPFGFLFSAFDSKLVAGILPGETFKIGAQLAVADLANFGKGSDAFDFAFAYSSGDTFGDWVIDANAGAKFLLEPSKFGMLYGFGISNGAIIQNTSLYIKYKGEHAKDIGGADLKGTVTVGTKISL